MFWFLLALSCQKQTESFREDALTAIDPSQSTAFGELLTSPRNVEMRIRESFPLNASLFFTYDRHQDVSELARWTSSDEAVLRIDVVDKRSYVTALTPGRATIRAQFESFSAESELAVIEPQVETAVIASTQKVLSLALTENGLVAERIQLRLVGLYRDGTTADLSQEAIWTSSDNKLLLANSNGAFLATGTGSITVAAAWGGRTYSSKIEIKAVEKTLVRLSISEGATILPLRTPENLQVVAHFSDGTSADISNSAEVSAEDPTAISATAAEGSYRLTGLREGSSKILCKFQNQALSTLVKVIDPTYSRLLIESTENFVLGTGTSDIYRATLELSDGQKVDVSSRTTWTSSNKTIVDVSSIETEKSRLIGRRAGQAEVTAQYAGVETKFLITVGAARPISLEITSTDTGPLGLYLSRSYQAQALYSDGVTRDVTRSIQWRAETISGNGYFDPLSLGRFVSTERGLVRLMARLSGIEAQVDVEIGAVSPASIEVGNISVPWSILTGPKQLKGLVKMSDGQVIDQTSQVKWSYTTSGEGISFAGMVENEGDRKGFFTPLAPGKVRLFAISGSLSIEYVIEVVP